MPNNLLLPLITKVLLPRLSAGLIERPRFLAVLAQASEKRLILIKASAGFGKTSLALDWATRLRRDGKQVAWLALEADDDEPSRFLYYLAQALQHGCDGAGAGALALISEASLVAPHAVTAALINALAEIEDETYLFLDDYHYVNHPMIHEAIAFFLRHAPGHFHLVLMTRAEPALHLSRLRVQNEMLEIDTATLRFALDETRRFLEREQSGRMDATDIKLLHNTTEGWPAALRIAASSALWHSDDIEQHVHALSGASRPFAAYLEDMLARLPPETVLFMSRTAILDHLSAPLCQAITGVKDSQSALESLASRQLLLEPLDQEGRWYRYHHLLREYLYRRLEARFGAELPKLHRRAYRWFAAQEQWTEATKHAFAAGDLEQAISMINNCAMRLVQKGDLHTLLGWQRQFPSHLMRGQTNVRLAIAWGLTLAMRSDEALALLTEIKPDLPAGDSPVALALTHEWLTIEAVLVAFTDDSEAALSLAESCYAQHPRDAWTANVLSNVLRFGYWKAGRLDSFYATPWVPYSLEEDRRNVFSSVYRLCFQGLVELQQLRTDAAERSYTEAMRLAEIHVGPQSAAAALPASLLAQIRFEQGRPGDAEAIIIDRLATMNAIGMIEHMVRTYIVLARTSALNMHLDRAYALLDQAEVLGHTRRWERVVAAVLLERLRLYLGEGRGFEASACLERLERLVEQHPGAARCAWSEIHDCLVLARAAIAMAENRPHQAATLLRQLHEQSLADHNAYFALGVGTALAVALFAANDVNGALDVFGDVVKAGNLAKAQRTILDQGPEVGPLLQQLRDGGGRAPRTAQLDAYLDVLLAAWRAAYADPTPMAPAKMHDSLSPREREILALIADGQSNKEIARSLGITPETVKSHLKHIFVKLAVTKRSQAVQRAHTLDVIYQPSSTDGTEVTVNSGHSCFKLPVAVC